MGSGASGVLHPIHRIVVPCAVQRDSGAPQTRNPEGVIYLPRGSGSPLRYGRNDRVV